MGAPEQQEAAGLFRDYLLGEPAQRLALHYGFRPANAAVSLTANEPNNMFRPRSTSAFKKICRAASSCRRPRFRMRCEAMGATNRPADVYHALSFRF